MAEADELDFAKLKLDVGEDWIAEVVALADAVTDNGVVVGTPVEADRPDVDEGSAEGIDVGVEAEGIRVGVELGVAEDATQATMPRVYSQLHFQSPTEIKASRYGQNYPFRCPCPIRRIVLRK